MVSKSETELCALEITIRIVERWLVVLWMSCGNFHRNIVTLPLEEKYNIRYTSSEINKCCENGYET